MFSLKTIKLSLCSSLEGERRSNKIERPKENLFIYWRPAGRRDLQTGPISRVVHGPFKGAERRGKTRRLLALAILHFYGSIYSKIEAMKNPETFLFIEESQRFLACKQKGWEITFTLLYVCTFTTLQFVRFQFWLDLFHPGIIIIKCNIACEAHQWQRQLPRLLLG